jgi:hypothetical protein
MVTTIHHARWAQQKALNEVSPAALSFTRRMWVHVGYDVHLGCQEHATKRTVPLALDVAQTKVYCCTVCIVYLYRV